MLGLDERIADLGAGGGVVVALLMALLLGLRHATDPDHLTAVTTLVMSDERHGGRRASLLGLCWGAGHATTLFLLGLPVVLLGRALPEPIQRGAEVAIGLLIVGLALRLLLRWRRGYFHAHPHRHGSVRHAHPHVHERMREAPSHDHAAHHPAAHDAAAHHHAHSEALGRSPLASFGIGLVHGVGGSAGAAILLIAATPDRLSGSVALALFAAATAVSMALCSSAFGHALARRPLASRMARLVPGFGALGVLFGLWYVLGAVELAPYLF